MPLRGAPRPPKERLQEFTGWLAASLDSQAAANPNPGHATVRRLNRTEYANAVRDLLALNVDFTKEMPADVFVGHVGGDDFVVIVPEHLAEELAAEVVRRFDAAVPGLYDEDDRARGHIVRTDRRGVLREFRFVGVSLGIVPISRSRFVDAVAVSRAAAEVKEIAKRSEGSGWAVDRRRSAEGPATPPA